MKNKHTYIAILWMSTTLFGCGAKGHEIYVSPNGNDSANGKLSTPVASLQHAAALVRKRTGDVPVTVFLSGGHYRLTEPLELGTEDGGGAGLFVSDINELCPNRTYYIRAYASNSVRNRFFAKLIFPM